MRVKRGASLNPGTSTNTAKLVDSIRAKMAEIEQQRVTHLANANACVGAIQAFQAMLAELAPGPVAVPTPDAPPVTANG